MRQNPARRTALLDAAIEVLAREGSRGLTLRAVDGEAGVPTGTASNYFSNRAEMLGQVLRRTRERMAPDPVALEAALRSGSSTATVVTLMHQLLDRTRAERSSHLAMLELRLEATRRPELGEELTRFLAAELEDNIRYHLDTGLRGDRIGVLLLYLGMLGLIVDDLTVPDILAAYPVEQVVAEMVERLLPDTAGEST